MKYLVCEKVNDRIYAIRDLGLLRSYLVLGDSRAALIDTGVGIGDLKGLVSSITELPVIVICTHYHLDHVGGAIKFDQVYLHEKDIPLVSKTDDRQARIDYAKHIQDSVLNNQDVEIDMDEVVETKTDGYLPMKGGDIFDLGGIHLEIIECPGHTPGSSCVLIVEERCIVFGDACAAMTWIFTGNGTVAEYKEALLKLKQREDDYDTVLFPHNNMTEPKSVLDDCIEVCDEIIAGTDEKIPYSTPVTNGTYLLAKAGDFFGREDGKKGNIVYNPNKIC